MIGGHHRIGFVASQFNQYDHVSRESAIWQEVLTELGHECFFFSGETTQPEEHTLIVPEANYRHPDIVSLNADISGPPVRSSKTSGKIQALRFHIKQQLHQFIQTFDINRLVVENALSLPLNIPLGLALSEVISETGIATLARHHDLVWEVPRYHCSPAEDYIHTAFPPKLSSIQHIVASQHHAGILAQRAGIPTLQVPYARPFPPTPQPPPKDETTDSILGLTVNGAFVLITSPLWPASQIELTLSLIAAFSDGPHLVLTAPPGLGNPQYIRYLDETADRLGIRLLKISLPLPIEANPMSEMTILPEDYYLQTAFIPCVSLSQSAFAEAVEAMRYRRPLVVPEHGMVHCELSRRGFKLLTFDPYPDRESSIRLQKTLDDARLISDIVDHNYELGQSQFSLEIFRRDIAQLLR